MQIIKPDNISIGEAMEYVKYIEEKHDRKLDSVDISLDGEYVNVSFQFQPLRFERIRRITGYLVGSLDTWNDGKKAEEHDRVKHGMEEEL